MHSLDAGVRRMKVLIVDDNPAIRGAVRNLLETDPIFQICGEAENDREAIQRTAELRPELIIMDLSMPVLNGLDAARGIRRIKQAVPISWFSGYSDLLTKEEARSVGIAAVVPKSEPSMLLIIAAQKFSGRAPPEVPNAESDLDSGDSAASDRKTRSLCSAEVWL